ncbi:hypothetical protein [Subtercola boreus]|uniref:hypothetical protein n=1 Tax=Subtercola boreus TaxID=120213 RepID=UPI0015589E90|nr:hypothetical protein [Subtercola boreus]
MKTEAEASAEREVEQGLRELGRMRRHGSISETEFVSRRSALMLPVIERPVLG